MSQKCFVCNGSDGEPHFGGISCRACAAFFRRYFNSPKQKLSCCTCGTRYRNSHPCRSCRIQKCFEAGMLKEKVQTSRDKHISRTRNHLELVPVFNITHLVPLDTHHISNVWSHFQNKRSEIYGGKFIVHLNIYQLTSYVKHDINLFWDLVVQMFPETSNLDAFDKAALLANFVPKWWQIEPILNHIEKPEMYNDMSKEEFEDIVLEFYRGAFVEKQEMTREKILRTFVPIWIFYYTNMIIPIGNLNMDVTEILAFIWLSFFDYAYVNISEKCSEMCRNIKKVILKKLRNHLIGAAESRFFEIISVPLIIERGEKKFQEEMLICEMNNIQIHDDFKSVMNVNKV